MHYLSEITQVLLTDECSWRQYRFDILRHTPLIAKNTSYSCSIFWTWAGLFPEEVFCANGRLDGQHEEVKQCYCLGGPLTFRCRSMPPFVPCVPPTIGTNLGRKSIHKLWSKPQPNSAGIKPTNHQNVSSLILGEPRRNTLKGPYHQLSFYMLKHSFCWVQRLICCPNWVFDSPTIKQKLKFIF